MSKERPPIDTNYEEAVFEKEEAPPRLAHVHSVAESEAGGFDVGKTLEKPGFYEYLQRHAIVNPEGLDENQLKNLDTAFEATNAASDFYRENIKKEAGVEIDDKEIRPGLEFYFVNLPDPRFGEQLIGMMKEYKELPQRIAEKEEQIVQLGGHQAVAERLTEERGKERLGIERLGTLGMMEGRFLQKKINSETMRGIRGFFNWRNSETIRFIFGAARKEVGEYQEAKTLTPDAWQKEIDQTYEAIDKETEKLEVARDNATVLKSVQEEYKKHKEQVENIRGLLFGEYFGPASDVMKIAKAKVQEKLNSLVDTEAANPDDYMFNVEEGLDLLSRLEKSPVELIGKKDQQEFNKEFEEMLDWKARLDIGYTLKGLKIGSPFAEVEKDLRKLFEAKTYGAAKSRIDQGYVRKRLEEYVGQAASPEGETEAGFKAKKLAVKLFLMKLSF